MKEKFKAIVQFIANPKLLLCFAIAWFITNGWAYLLIIIGTLLKAELMVEVGGAYVLFLWLPFVQEKIVTISISILLLRLLFPEDKQTLSVLKIAYHKTLNKLKKIWKRKDLSTEK